MSKCVSCYDPASVKCKDCKAPLCEKCGTGITAGHACHKGGAFSSLPVGGIDSIKDALEIIQHLKEKNPDKPIEEHLAFFFCYALTPFYDCMWDGMRSMGGHLIYRLSDQVPQEVRESIKIYPNAKGSLEVEGERWESLEDWRKEWEEGHDDIPTCTPLLEDVGRLVEE